MQRLTQEEIVAAKRIYNRVNDLIGNYYGRKTADQIKEFVSTNRWIMFPVNNVTSLKEGASHPVPNIFISFDGDIVDNSNGQVNGWIGLTYNNSQAMLWLHESLRVKNAPAFFSILNSLNDNWNVLVEQKIKTNYQDNTPKFRTMSSFKPKIVTAIDIKEAIKKSDTQLPQKDDDYESERVLNAITMLSIIRETNTANFDDDVKSAFELFFKVLNRDETKTK